MKKSATYSSYSALPTLLYSTLLYSTLLYSTLLVWPVRSWTGIASASDTELKLQAEKHQRELDALKHAARISGQGLVQRSPREGCGTRTRVVRLERSGLKLEIGELPKGIGPFGPFSPQTSARSRKTPVRQRRAKQSMKSLLLLKLNP